MADPTPPRILLVEDDPVSRAFLSEALSVLPVVVDGAPSQAEALRIAGPLADRHALWLVDANLPDGDGVQVLHELCARHGPGHAPAVAHTADASDSVREALLAAGFDAVLVKPIDGRRLRQAVLYALGQVAAPPSARAGGGNPAGIDWDDETALRALAGEQAHVVALRGLFLDELPGMCAQVNGALHAADERTARHVLHRLQASCGFVGAMRLQQRTQVLHARPREPGALTAFNDAVAALLVKTAD